ncbi:MAG: hypothetical protein B7O98_00610 [Zestosphaera tikiterensis]|uniref:Uncharacterized protein n=1 Tax=Zestosphaera tikiterensis TaxID=1973259 RepID=A0A2R7Y8U8_9CREN|nr:MAG: hypothetical protein B7O98_00610 [Zestosphaera tikiterensis]
MLHLKMYVKSRTSFKSSVLALIFIALFTTASTIHTSYGYSQVDYYLNTDGSTTIHITLRDVNTGNISLMLEGTPIPETIVAQDIYGIPLTTELRGNTLIVESVGNASEIRVSYVTINSINVSEGIIKYVLNPPSLSNVYIPSNMALVNYTGKPDLSLIDSYVVLTYPQRGTYVVTVALIPQAVTEASLTTMTYTYVTSVTVKQSSNTQATLTSTTQASQSTFPTPSNTSGRGAALILGVIAVGIAIAAFILYLTLRRK